MTKRRLILTISIVLIAVGIGFIAYPLVLRVHANILQDRLAKEFNEHLSYPHIIFAAPEEQELPQWTEFPPTLLEIPAIKLSVHIEAIDDMDLFNNINQMPSYYPQSSYPGEVGNVTIAGHRGGPAGYFGKLKNLKPGDAIILHTPGISYYYEVEKVFKVKPTAVEVLDPLDYAAITFTTCYSSSRRLIVRGRFVKYVFNPGE